MITVRFPSHLFGVLHSTVSATAWGAPISESVISRVLTALAKAQAGAVPGLPVVLTLRDAEELFVMGGCFEVGAEPDPNVTDDQMVAIEALIEQAALRA